MEGMAITFAPVVPMAVIWALGALALAATIVAFWYKLRGAWTRALALGVLVLALTGPQLREEERANLPNIAFLVVDRSDSTSLEDRSAQIEEAAAALAQSIPTAGGPRQPLELVTVNVDTTTSGDDRGTQMLTALDEATAQVSPGQIAGAILLTDGQVHDVDRLASFPAPVHALIAGEEYAFDLRLTLETAPAFGIVGEEVTFTVRAEAIGTPPAGIGARAPALVAVDGGTPEPVLLELGAETEITVTIEHGGPTVVDFQLPGHPDELTKRNNRIIATVNGVRDRLRVLLVSGEPHPGGRTWRDLLKSDPAVELIHFTILRPPSKQDGTPVSELSLIAFPTRELFLEKISGFDLIVFDRYRWRGVLSSGYLANVSRYVRDGGAVLVASGPAFSGAQSLNRTPLAEILPAEPTVNVIERAYRPSVTGIGERHPVTAGLGDDESWGRWLRQIEVEPRAGSIVMSGVDEKPLLLLDRVGEGRVALLASDHAWLWSRGYDGGGPQADLLRRVAHWLMREPELEEEALFARVEGDRVLLERRTLADEAPDSVRATPPDGGAAEVLQYEQIAPGRWQALLEAADEGLWRMDDGDAQTVAAVGPPSPMEFANPVASTEPLAALVDASDGSARWLAAGIPNVRMVDEGRRSHGRGWVALTQRDAFRVTGVRLSPLLPAWLAMLIIAALLVGGWLREGR
ncbi:MAG: glutamine amidotransferase [Pseudomonadota bacterium]